MKPEFTTQHLKPNKQVLSVKGDLTTQWSNAFKAQLNQLQEMIPKKNMELDIVISLQEVTAIDASALQLLHVFRTFMKTTGYFVSILPPDLPPVMELITGSGWSYILFRNALKQTKSN